LERQKNSKIIWEEKLQAEWEEKLQALYVTKGVNSMIAIYQESVTNLERVKRLDHLGMSIVDPNRSVNSYCPSNERLKRFLLSALEKAPTSSPFHRLAVDMRLQSNAGVTPDQIVDLIREYKDIGYDTFPVRRITPLTQDRRHQLGQLGNRGERYQGGYRGTHASYGEEEHEYDYVDEYYEDEEPDEDLNASYASQGPPRQYIRYPCANYKKDDHIVKDCPSLICGACNKKFDTAGQRKAHWHAEHRYEEKSTSGSNTPDRRLHDNKRRPEDQSSPHLKQVQPRRSERNKTPHNSSRSSNSVEPEYDYYGPRDEEEDQPEI
jgi:hypothetical protein